jgi:DNA polymerase-3 subunit alpha
MSDSNENLVHLHAHSEYSQLDAVGTVEHVVAQAKKKGFKALAQTDHGTVSGGLKFARECKKNGIKPILGCEIYIVDDVLYRKPENVKKEREDLYHTIVLAKSWDGFVSLQKLLTKAYSKDGFYYKPRVGWNDTLALKDCVISTACVGGMLSHDDYVKKAEMFNETFKEDFYFEVQPHQFDLQYNTNMKALQLANRFGRKLIATNDFHYANAEDCHAQECLLATARKQTKSSDNKWDFTPGLWMKTYPEMIDSFLGMQKSVLSSQLVNAAVLNTVEVAEKCNWSLPNFEVELPNVNTTSLGTSDQVQALKILCVQGWKKRFPDMAFTSEKGKPYWERLTKELDTVIKLNFEKYFLLVQDIYRYCDSVGIAYGPGRGSGAGSLVCYLLGITNADPLTYGLIFERFINPERIDLPDLDLDFEHDRRDEVYQYLLQTYKHVAHIATFNGMNTKQVLKDVCRYEEIDLKVVDVVCKEIDEKTAKQDKAKLTLQKVEDEPEKYPQYAAFKEKNFSILEVAKVLEGQVRQTGIHPGGVIVSSEPLENRVAVEYRKGEYTINYDMYDVGFLGLLKVDVLGSKTVSVLEYTKKMIEETSGKELDFQKIDLEDKPTLMQFNMGQTTGVFQFESPGMRKMLREMAPHDINTLITANAMYRPGPLQFKDTYVKNKKTPNLIKSTGNAALDKITRDTYGVFIYQEQVMQIAVEVAGYTYPESDTLRKKISKSKGKEEIEKDRLKFVEGCISFGKLSDAAANELFSEIVDFGRYCFNKSHATTYTLVSYYAMWLRTHFPCEFLSAQIAHSKDEDRPDLRKEVGREDVQYLPTCINRSHKLCSVEILPNGKKALRAGFNEISGIGDAVIDAVLKTRGEVQFLSFDDFFNRLENRRVVNIKAQEILLSCGAFASMHDMKAAKAICISLRQGLSKKGGPPAQVLEGKLW